MKQLTINGQELLLVPIDKWAENIRVISVAQAKEVLDLAKADFPDDCKEVLFYTDKPRFLLTFLPAGSWRFIGIASEISEDVAAGLMPSEFDTFLHYGLVDDEWGDTGAYACATATESLASLLTAHGFSATTTAILTAEK